MKFIEQVGNIKIYTERVKENDDVFIDVMCCNGSKIIIKEGRCITDIEMTELEVVEKVLRYKLNLYTESVLHFLYANVIKVDENTYKVKRGNIFKRIGTTRYFKCAQRLNKTIISIRFKRFLIMLEKIGKSDIINIHKGSESE